MLHHLDCGTMCPRGAVALGLAAPDPGHLVDHCLLVETDDGLLLVDTGFGTADVRSPRRLGPARALLGARLRPDRTAVAQVGALGHGPADVRHVVLTHLDLDHAGGLGDFPDATVHVHATELEQARRRPGDTRLRYRPAQWAHHPRWSTHEAVEGEDWHGFGRVRPVDGLDVEVLMIPLPGHTAGHTGVAVRTSTGWLLHAGDAYLRREELTDPNRRSPGLAVYHRLNSVDEALRRTNLARLAELAADPAAGVAVICSHDARDLLRFGG